MGTQSPLNSICYRQNFLSQVVARVDLVSPVAGVQTELPKELARAALEYFPIDEPRPVYTQELLVSKNELRARKHEFTEWNFFGKQREKRLTMMQTAFFVVYTKYQSYEQLRQEFLHTCEAFFECCGEAQPSRMGLRFVNEIRIEGTDPLEWSSYIDSELLHLLDYSVRGAQPIRLFHNLEFSFGEFNLTFNFGLHNPDYPAPIRQRVFILDFDAYYKGLLEPPDLAVLLDKYHRVIQERFEVSITDATRAVMNGV